MDAQRLDDLSRLLARGPSRRTVLAGLGIVLTARPLRQPTPAGAQEGEGWVMDEGLGGFCRLPGFPCGNSGQCCAGGCGADGTCGCRKRGRSAFSKVVCCSGKKQRGNKGVCR